MAPQDYYTARAVSTQNASTCLSFMSADNFRYFISLAYLGLLRYAGIIKHVSVGDLRRTNLWAAGALPFLLWPIVEKNASKYDGFRRDRASLPRFWSLAQLNHAILNICLFPPLFFFYGLYYTDVWSALFVLIAVRCHQKKERATRVIVGLAALLFRQTNIFWVSIFLGGLEITQRVPRGRPGVEFPERPTTLDVISGSWTHCRVHNPIISQASFQGTSRLRSPIPLAPSSAPSVRHSILTVIGRLRLVQSITSHCLGCPTLQSHGLSQSISVYPRLLRAFRVLQWRRGSW